MIANPTEHGWEVIYHRAHALLAAQIAARWGREERPARLIETIAAIFHHDDLEREWRGDHRTPAGAPLDYTLNPEIDVDLLRGLVAGAVYRGLWVALLVSLQVSYVQEPRRGRLAQLDAFLDEQKELQERTMRELGVSREEVDQAHLFVRWCDQLSLLLCKREVPDGGRAVEIGPGPDGRRHDLRQREDGTLAVEPWPFGPDRFTVTVEARDLPQLSFKTDAALTKALQEASPKVLRWELVE